MYISLRQRQRASIAEAQKLLKEAMAGGVEARGSLFPSSCSEPSLIADPAQQQQQQQQQQNATVPISATETDTAAATAHTSVNGAVSANASSRITAAAAAAGGRRQQLQLQGAGAHLLKSSASTPSLRSRESEIVTMVRSGTPENGGGNVRVVVRVRGFLPRGECNL